MYIDNIYNNWFIEPKEIHPMCLRYVVQGNRKMMSIKDWLLFNFDISANYVSIDGEKNTVDVEIKNITNFSIKALIDANIDFDINMAENCDDYGNGYYTMVLSLKIL